MLSKLESFSKIIAAVFIPIAIAYMGNKISEANSQRDAQTKLVELAIEILNKEQTGKIVGEERSLREWAVKIVDSYSGIPLPKETKVAIIENKVKLPGSQAADAESSTWAVVFGADKTLKEAQYEVALASKKGLGQGQIFLRSGSYRSVIVAANRSEAEELLGKFKSFRDSSYMIRMERWCPNSVSQTNHIDCILT